ncbi:MAG: hypothetical protein FJ225_08095 [Lentisphaerae bacterium]|nr:hypothetical protein [Lentisphaerota bacterium]
MGKSAWTIRAAAALVAGILLLTACESEETPAGFMASLQDQPGDAVQTPDISGDWTMHRMPGTFESEDQCTMAFTQDGENVSARSGGNLLGLDAFYWPGTIRGTIAGTNVNFRWTYWSVGPTYLLKGAVGKDEDGNPVMSGTWTDEAGLSGEWKAEAEEGSAMSLL